MDYGALPPEINSGRMYAGPAVRGGHGLGSPGRGRLLRAGAQETVGPTRKSVNMDEHALQRTAAY